MKTLIAAPEGSVKFGLAYFGLIATVITWGFIPVFQKRVLVSLTPVEFNFSRFFLTSILLLAWVLLKNRSGLIRMIREDFWPLVLSMIMGPLLALLLLSYGIKTMPIGIVAIVVAFEPILTYVFAVFAKQERWNVRRMISIGIALVGLVLIVYIDRKTNFLWQGLVVTACASAVWAINTIISKKLVVKHSPVAMMTFNFSLGSLCLIPALGDHYLVAMKSMGPSMWMSLLFCVIPGTVLGFSVWYTSLKYVSPSSVSISLYLKPIVSVLGGILYLNETISTVKTAGLGLAMFGIYLVSFRHRN